MRRWGVRRVAASGFVFAVMTSGSAAASAPPVPEASAPPAAAELFGSAGVTVSAIDSPVAGTGLSLTDWQADNLIRQARAGEGWTGAQWRERFPLPDGVVPLDFIVAGWLAGQQTPAAIAARQLSDPAPLLDVASPMDPANFVIPPAVVALFLHDVATTDAGETGEVPATSAAASAFRRVARLPAQVDACEGLLTFYDGALTSIYGLVGGKESVLGQLAQQAVGLLPIPKPAYSIPKKNDMGNFQALGLLIGLAGAINPWTISIETTPDPVAYGVAPAAGNEAVARLVVDPGISVEWPAPLRSCASLAGIDLPDISPVGAVVTWDPIADGLAPHASVVDHTDLVMSDGTQFYADLRYVTAVESAEQAGGAPTAAALPIVAHVQRPGDQTFKGVVDLAIQRYLGPDSYFGAALGALVAPLLESLDEINSPLPTYAFPIVTFHIPPEPPTPDQPATSPPPPPTDEAWRSCVDRDLHSQATATLPGGVLLRISADGTSMHYDFSGSQPITVTEGGATVTIQLAGTIDASGSPTGSGFQSSVSVAGMGLAGVATIEGQAITIDPSAFRDIVVGNLDTAETLRCDAGTVVIERTGQVYS